MNSSQLSKGTSKRQALLSMAILAVILMAVLSFLFSASFNPDLAQFSNDGPLGIQNSLPYRMPAGLLGVWYDFGWIGTFGGSFTPNFSGLLLWFLGPVGFNKFHIPIAQLVLGLSAGLYFRTLRFSSMACVLGGIGAALNSNFFSNACWGLSSRSFCLASAFLALATLQSSFGRNWLVKIILCGLAIGLSITEGADNGAILSLFLAAYAFYATLILPGGLGAKVAKGAGKVAIMAFFAAVMAAQTLNVFAGFAAKELAKAEQAGRSSESQEQHWDWATQWSLPKIETLRVIIPGLFGYRLDTPEGGNYWGLVGQQPGWEKHHQGFPRHSGSGEYAGVMVVLVAGWALAQALRRKEKDAIFAPEERKAICFWAGAAFVALLLAWGRFAPFYRIFYELPYFSTIRNPMKFMHPLHLALMVLFAYGLEGLWRACLQGKVSTSFTLFGQYKAWWAKASVFDRRWIWGCLGAICLSGLGFLVYAASKPDLAKSIAGGGFPNDIAESCASFSIMEVGIFVVVLAVSSAILAMILCGALSGPRSKWAGVLVGVVLVLDLVRANAYWIQPFNYKQRYATNPIFDILRDKPYEHRVLMPPFQFGQPFATLQQVYQVEWLQHEFPYYHIQSLDVTQDPRPPADKAAYLRAVGGNVTRLWQLTNSRFIFGMGGQFVDALNNQLDPAQKRYRIHTLFELGQGPKPNTIYAQTNTTGPFALIEFTGALPRAMLCTNWLVDTDDQSVLTKLASPEFDPASTVIVSASVAPPAQPGPSAKGSVEYASYLSDRIVLKTEAPARSVLLLNDRFDPNWQVFVDGKREEVLRCNYIMRGVEVPPGAHTVTFAFMPSAKGFWLMVGCLGFGLLLSLYLAIPSRRI